MRSDHASLFPTPPYSRVLYSGSPKPDKGANLAVIRQPSTKDGGMEKTLVSTVINLRTDLGEDQYQRAL